MLQHRVKRTRLSGFGEGLKGKPLLRLLTINARGFNLQIVHDPRNIIIGVLSIAKNNFVLSEALAIFLTNTVRRRGRHGTHCP